MDLWEFLRQAVEYDGVGKSKEWTDFSFAMLEASNLKELSGWYNPDTRHYFLRSIVPVTNKVVVPSSSAIDVFKRFFGRQGLENLTKDLFLTGLVRGKPGLVSIMDGTADQQGLLVDYAGDELKGGFYGAEMLVPSKQLAGHYERARPYR
jgi:hypothetical protein